MTTGDHDSKFLQFLKLLTIFSAVSSVSQEIIFKNCLLISQTTEVVSHVIHTLYINKWKLLSNNFNSKLALRKILPKTVLQKDLNSLFTGLNKLFCSPWIKFKEGFGVETTVNKWHVYVYFLIILSKLLYILLLLFCFLGPDMLPRVVSIFPSQPSK